MKNLRNLFKGAKDRYAIHKAKETFLSLLLTTCAAFTACTDEVENISQENRATLQLNVGVNQPTSRAIVEGKTLPNTAQIGVSVVDNTGTAYQNQNYNNVLYTAAEVQGKQTWSTTANVTLSGEEATLYAYYPYATGPDIAAIPVDMTETDQKDWMYATPVTGLSDGKSTAEVQLNHALTDLRLTFYKDTYSGEGEVTEFSIQSTGMAVGGTLNAKTGEITLPATPVNTITRSADFTLTDKASATPIDVMLIPTGTEAPVTVSVTVDGHTYSASTTAFTLQKAKAYNYVMKLTSTGLEVTSVALTDWNEVLLPDATFEPVQQNPYADYLKLTYNVEYTDEPCYIFSPNCESENESWYNGLKMADIAEMIVDGKSVTPNYKYTFSSVGEHTVYIKFKDMTTIPESAFENCYKLVEVYMPDSFLEIGVSAFYGCTGLKNVKIGNNVQTIGNYAFDCSGVTSVTIPNSVKTIGDLAFYRCEGLTSVTVGSGVQTIGYEAFRGCTGLTGELIIPNSVKTIGAQAFWNCPELTSVIIEEGVETIGEGAFYCCYGLTGELVIPNSVQTIGEGAFAQCMGLTGIRVDAGNTVYDSRGTCNAIMETATNTLVSGCKNTIIPEDCESIGNYAFEGCTELTSLTIPNSVKTIGVCAFYQCYAWTGQLTIPEGVTSIGERAFYECSGLTGVTIPNSVTSIEYMVFAGCGGFTSVTIPKSVQTIGKEAFSACTGLTSLIIEEGVKTIGEEAFGSCNELTKVTIPNSVTSIGENTFEYCSGLTEVIIGNGVQTIGSSAFYRCSGLNKITSLAMTAPSIQNITFWYVKSGGVLYVPAGATGYDTWMKSSMYYLGYYNWTKVEQ